MDLTTFQHHILRDMPGPSFGQDKADYCRSVIAWAQEQGCPMHEAIRCAEFKWQSWEIERLIADIEAGSEAALRAGVLKLLKEKLVP